MSTDFVVEILPDVNDQLYFIVKARDIGLPEAGARYLRQRINLTPEDIKTLRLGNASPVISRKVATEVSQWLLGADLNGNLTAALGRPEPIRLVINVDERLLPALADVPVELLTFAGSPFVLRQQVHSIVHLLPKVGIPQNTAATPDWPLRVLVLRSNPRDLGGAVPLATPIRDAVVNLATQHLGPIAVQVDVLSSEPDVAKPTTWEAFREQIHNTNYHILLYLGHGDLLENFEGLPPVGVLQFESEDGQAHTPVASEQLRAELQINPVPVVLLIGCLTAAQIPAGIKVLVDENTPQWMRGGEGVAQALVNGECGVQFALGMRYRLETQAAVSFLQGFFRSLFSDAPGDLEMAVRAGRSNLYAISPYPPNWSAPVIFRTLGKEPTFGFMASPPAAGLGVNTLIDERDQAYRTAAWTSLIQQPIGTRVPGGLTFQYQVLADAEQRIKERAVAGGAFIVPERVEAQHNQTVSLPVNLHGNLNVNRLSGKLVVSSEGASIQSLRATPALKTSGYRVFYEYPEDNQAFFEIRKAQNGGGNPLPEGTLFEATLSLGDAFPVVYPVNIDGLETQPPRQLKTGNNAIIVPPP